MLARCTAYRPQRPNAYSFNVDSLRGRTQEPTGRFPAIQVGREVAAHLEGTTFPLWDDSHGFCHRSGVPAGVLSRNCPANPVANAHGRAYPDAHRHRCAHSYAHSRAYLNSNRRTYAHPSRNSLAYTDGYAHCHTDSDAHSNARG